MLQATYKRAWA